MSEHEHPETAIRCTEIEMLAMLDASGELEDAAHAALRAHCEQCAACAAVLSREIRLHEAMAALEEPAASLDRSGLLLAQCRSELAEALDDKQAGANQPVWRAALLPAAGWTMLRRTLVYHPIASMAVLVLAGFFAGLAGQRWRIPPAAAPHAVAAVVAPPKLTDQQLQSAGGANVTWVTPADSRTPTVQVHLMSQTPMNIVGSPDDADVRRALTFVLTNGERFDSSARLDSLEVLRTRSEDLDVRHALCTAARSDQDPDVRVKAVETLEGFEQDALVRQTLIDALEKDGNSGVRAQAIRLLLNALPASGESAAADPQIIGVLRDRSRHDPDDSIRLQSAAALRRLGADTPQ